MMRVRLLWKSYILQSLFATAVIFIMLLFLSIEHAVIIASMGLTAFIVFAMPGSFTARERNVVGGHLLGLLSGSLWALPPQPSFLHSITFYSLAVSFSILLMVITNTEHPPASGTALGVVLKGPSVEVVLAVITSAVLLSLAHWTLRPFLKDLT
jgi:CBS-domain-containing membrane protein